MEDLLGARKTAAVAVGVLAAGVFVLFLFFHTVFHAHGVVFIPKQTASLVAPLISLERFLSSWGEANLLQLMANPHVLYIVGKLEEKGLVRLHDIQFHLR